MEIANRHGHVGAQRGDRIEFEELLKQPEGFIVAEALGGKAKVVKGLFGLFGCGGEGVEATELVDATLVVAVLVHKDATVEVALGIGAVHLGIGEAGGHAAQGCEYEMAFHK